MRLTTYHHLELSFITLRGTMPSLRHVQAHIYKQTYLHFGFDVHCIIMVTTHYVRWICRCTAAGNALIKQTQTTSKRWLSSLQTVSWINSPHSKIVACYKYQANVSELSELKNVTANCFWCVDIALSMNWMYNWLTFWCLTSGMSMTQCDAQNADCQV